MKQLIIILTAVAMVSTMAWAEEGYHHHEKHDKIKGPHGGRIMETGDKHLEFFATEKRKVEVRFYSHDMKPSEVKDAQIQIVAQAPSGTQKIDLAAKEGVFTSDTALPEGNHYNIVVRVKLGADEKFKNLRFLLNTTFCEGCKLAEYACVCEGHNH